MAWTKAVARLVPALQRVTSHASGETGPAPAQVLLATDIITSTRVMDSVVRLRSAMMTDFAGELRGLSNAAGASVTLWEWWTVALDAAQAVSECYQTAWGL
jgi:hypothetical protein